MDKVEIKIVVNRCTLKEGEKGGQVVNEERDLSRMEGRLIEV